ncbi:MAG: oxidoreductase, partial [Gammaproteobacteria bacterium]|nr:oxidoreductase [Gammaproteobacteria bacterium]
GASVSGASLNRNKKFASLWPGVLEAFRLIGSEQIQGRASLGGNLCNGSPAGDSVPALIAAGCVAVIAGPDGRKELPIEEFHEGPGRTILKNGEMLVSLKFPKREKNSADAYLRMTPRTEMDIAVVSAGVNLTLEKGVIKTARVALGAVAPTALLVENAAKAIVGTKLDDEALDALAAACSAACNPIDDKRGTVEYRTRVAGVLAKRAANIAFERAGGKK